MFMFAQIMHFAKIKNSPISKEKHTTSVKIYKLVSFA